MKIKDDIDSLSLAKMTPGFSGADIASMVNNATIIAVDKGLNEITEIEFEDSRDRIKYGIKKRNPFKKEQQLYHSAIHQAGHALICYMNPICRENLYKVTIEQYSESKGDTLVLTHEKRGTKDEFYSKIDMALGGVLAEEIVFGKKKLTPGCGKDLSRVNKIAENLVKKLGMNQDWGYSVVKEGINQHKISDVSRDRIACSSKDIITLSEIRVRNLLNDNKDILLKLANKLSEKKSLRKHEIEELIQQRNYNAYFIPSQVLNLYHLENYLFEFNLKDK